MRSCASLIARRSAPSLTWRILSIEADCLLAFQELESSNTPGLDHQPDLAQPLPRSHGYDDSPELDFAHDRSSPEDMTLLDVWASYFAAPQEALVGLQVMARAVAWLWRPRSGFSTSLISSRRADVHCLPSRFRVQHSSSSSGGGEAMLSDVPSDGCSMPSLRAHSRSSPSASDGNVVMWHVDQEGRGRRAWMVGRSSTGDVEIQVEE